jgi:ferredoxin-NADP reductase
LFCRLGAPVLAELGVPRDADFYLCGPAAFMADLSAGLAGWGVSSNCIHTEIFGAGPSLTPGVARPQSSSGSRSDVAQLVNGSPAHEERACSKPVYDGSISTAMVKEI